MDENQNIFDDLEDKIQESLNITKNVKEDVGKVSLSVYCHRRRVYVDATLLKRSKSHVCHLGKVNVLVAVNIQCKTQYYIFSQSEQIHLRLFITSHRLVSVSD